MEKAHFITTLILIAILNFNCDPLGTKCTDPPCVPLDKKSKGIDTNIIWQYNPDTLTNACGSMEPILYNNTIVFSKRFEGVDEILLFDKMTGKLINSYSDPSNPDWISGARYQYKNICVITGGITSISWILKTILF